MIDLLTSAMIWGRTLDAGTSLLLVALGGYLCVRSGVFNIALEGTMISSCFAAVACSFWAVNWGFGVLGAVATGVAVTAVLAVLCVYLQADVLLVGLAVNLFGLGATPLLLQWAFDIRGGFTSPEVRPLPHLDVPGVEAVPWLGDVVSGRSLLTYLAWLLTAAVTIWLGSPCATTAPSFIAIRWVAYRQAWLRSCSTATRVRPCSCSREHRSSTSIWWAMSR